MSERTAIRIALLSLGLAGWIVAAYLLWRTSVPSLALGGLDPHDYFSPRLLARAHHYGNGARVIWLVSTLAKLAALALLVWKLPSQARGIGLGRVSTAIVLGMVTVVTLWFVGLPFSIARLWWAHRYGLGPFSVWDWLATQWALLPAQALFALAAIALVVALAVKFQQGWWLPGATVVVGLAALLAFVSGWLGAAGTHPLPTVELRADAALLEAKEHVHPRVSVMEVGSWTNQPNAFTVGFGRSTHVVVWDTLLDGRFDRGQIDVVMAHELGHARSRHIPKEIAWYALILFPTALIVAFATRRRGGLRNPANLPLAIFVVTVVGLAATPLRNAVSRRYEAEADWRALVATDDERAAGGLFVKFGPTTLEDPTPPFWDYAFLETHPTVAQRLAMVEAYRTRRK